MVLGEVIKDISTILAWAAITKYYRLGSLNDKHLFFPVLEAGTSRIKVPVDSVFSEISPWL